MDDEMLTSYMDGGTPCVAISGMAGDVRLNLPYAGMMPRLYDMVDGHILSAFSASEIISRRKNCHDKRKPPRVL